MITAARQDRDPPFLPTLLCLWGAGWVTSLVTSFLFLGRAYPSGSPSAAMVAVNLLLSAAIGAIVVKQLLLSVVDCEISYTATLVALVGGSVASALVRLAFASELPHNGSSAVQPVAGLGFSFVPAMVGALVSWTLLQHAVRSETRDSAPVATAEVPDADPGWAEKAPRESLKTRREQTPTPFGEAISAVRESALGLVALVDSSPPEQVPGVIGDGLIGLQAARSRLETAPRPSEAPVELQQRLVGGLKQLEVDLVLIAQEAAATAGERLYQRGLLTSSMADVSDGGGRYRWELDQSDGLRAVRQALDDFEALGLGASW